MQKQINNNSDLDNLYESLVEDCEPRLVTNYTPEEIFAANQKGQFLAGLIRNPNNYYDRLECEDFDGSQVITSMIGHYILSLPDIALDKKFRRVYRDLINN